MLNKLGYDHEMDYKLDILLTAHGIGEMYRTVEDRKFLREEIFKFMEYWYYEG